MTGYRPAPSRMHARQDRMRSKLGSGPNSVTGVAMGAAMWSDVLAFLQTARFVDLLLPGSVDRTGLFPVRRPLTLALGVYLQAENGLIQFTSVNSNGGLRVRLAGRIEYDGDSPATG
jgi:hypothetical protein